MSSNLNHKHILVAITGGIAAYKVLDLIRRLQEHQAVVKVILTTAAKEFVTPLSIQALTGEKVHDMLLSAENEAAMSHIELARWADVLLIAPCTANVLAKCAVGLADDLLTTVCLATTAPIMLAPAMNQQMWQHPATQANIQALKQRGVKILGPGNGAQACGEFGPGRMLEPHELLDALQNHFAPQILHGKHLLITAGPTQEHLDPVRFISNHSSGKMGYALATAALNMGAHVTLISGPCQIPAPQSAALTFISVVTAQEMHDMVMQTIKHSNAQKIDIFIGCAAVADYAPIQKQAQKIKKHNETLSIELQRTPDILVAVATLAAAIRPITVGFAAETDDVIGNAQRKLQAKNLDLIFANKVGLDIGFNTEYNEIVIINKDLQSKQLAKMPKSHLAYELLLELNNLT